jgi:hypothetical protein
MDTIEQVFNFVNNRQFVTSENIADSTGLDLCQVIKALVILSGDKLIQSRFVGFDIVYDGKGVELPAVHCTPAPESSEYKPKYWIDVNAA